MISESNRKQKNRKHKNREYKKGYSSRKVLFLLLICCLGAAYLIWIRRGGFAIPCLFYKVTGLQCPGCGITRMILAVSEQDPKAALQANAFLFLTSPFLMFLLIYNAYKWVRNEKIGTKTEAFAAVYCVGLIIFGIIRNLV